MVRERFKTTEIGNFPCDWDLIPISKLATDMSDGPFGSNLKTEHYTKEKEVRLIQLSNIGDEGWQDSNVKYTTFEHAMTIARCIVMPGNVVIAKMMPAGRTIICPDTEKSYILSSDCVKVIVNEEKISPLFFMYLTKSKSFLGQIKTQTQGSTRARTSITKLKKTLMQIPTIDEQDAIATALSDMDNLIADLEKLIAKKKAIKQGAMQDLLTGKKRLPGFSGEWKQVPLGQLCDVHGRIGFRGYTKQDLVEKNFGAITLSPANIEEQRLSYSECTYISWDKYYESPEIMVSNGDIIFTKTASIGKMALVENLPEKATINPQLVLINNICCDNKYLYYQMAFGNFQKDILGITAGSTIPTMSQEKLKQLRIPTPEMNEQKKISVFLGDMDNEIISLQTKLEKYRCLKQGMMNKLLTGEIRLV